MKFSFCKTVELNGSSYVKDPVRSNAILNLKNNDKECFLWSKIACLHPCENDHLKKVSSYTQYFNESYIESFDFNIGFKSSNFDKFEKLLILSIDILELNCFQDQNNWKHNLILIESSKNESDRVVDLIIYEKQLCSL